MASSFDVNPYSSVPPAAPPALATGAEVAELLRQMVELQREQLQILKASAAAHDTGSRWKAFLARMREDFPEISDSCKGALTALEKAYGALIADLVDHIKQNGPEALDTDFALQEFLDRYGMRLTQLGTILNLVAPLAEASSQGESS
jgi:hypothetical protein